MSAITPTQQYLCYIYDRYIMSPTTTANTIFRDQLLTLESIKLTQFSKTIIQSEFNTMQLFLAKGIISYSPSNLQLKLSLSNLLLYQRVQKLQIFALQYLNPIIAQFVVDFLNNGVETGGMGFPILYSRSKLLPLLEITQKEEDHNDKKKGKNNGQKDVNINIQQKYNYSKLIYEFDSR